MKLISIWKSWFAANKVLTVVGTVAATALVVTGVTLGTIAALNNHAKPVTPVAESTEKETEKNTEKKNTEKIEISNTEYYEEELALDDSTENEVIEEAVYYEPVDLPYFIRVNRLMNTVTIYVKDESGAYTVPVKAMVCSVGLNDGTPLGTFTTSTKYEWRTLFSSNPDYSYVYGQYAFRINGPILFHSVPYYTPDKGNLESEEFNKLGEPASLGCVRLAVVDAKWLVDNCPSGTQVEIYDDPNPGPLGKPSMVKIDLASEARGWDPTDPDEANPWRSTPPTINGVVAAQSVERGGSLDLLSGVSAVAINNAPLSVTVEGSVDYNKVGDYAITYSAVDGFGNVVTAQSVVSVKDTVKPILTVLKTNMEIDVATLTAEEHINAVIANVTASDGNYAASVKFEDENQYNALITAIKGKTVGTYSVVYYAEDDSKLCSDKVTVTYVIKDTTPIAPSDPEPADRGEGTTQSTEQP